MKGKAAAALEVQAPPTAGERGSGSHRATEQHKSVPRWLRMSLRTSILVGLIALPTLALKDPTFPGMSQYRCVRTSTQHSTQPLQYTLSDLHASRILLGCRSFSMVFAALGAFVLPMWIPLLGDIVVAFTAVLPSECRQAGVHVRAACAYRLCNKTWWRCSLKVYIWPLLSSLSQTHALVCAVCCLQLAWLAFGWRMPCLPPSPT